MDITNGISEAEEAELRVMITELYKCGGVENVLACIGTMQRVQLIILEKLNEIISDAEDEPC